MMLWGKLKCIAGGFSIKIGEMMIDNKLHPGHHATSRKDKNVANLCALVLEDQRRTIYELEM